MMFKHAPKVLIHLLASMHSSLEPFLFHRLFPMFLRTAIGDIFVLRRGSVHLLYIDRSSNNIGAMPYISIDLRQL